MAITDTLTTIKDYFLSWHDKYYDAIHQKTTTDLNNEINNRITGDTNLNNRIDNLTASQVKDTTRNQSVQTTLDTPAQIGTIYGIDSYQADWRGFNPKVSGPLKDGYMTWQEKAQLRQLSTWYKVTRDKDKSLGDHMTLWINPAIRICHFKFAYSNFPVNKWDNITTNGAEWDWYSSSSQHFLDVCRPISNIWAPTNIPYINIGMDSEARFYIRSSKQITKALTIYGSLFWFYQDTSSPQYYERWAKK